MYNLYAKDIYRFSVWLSRDSDLAKDITSETFVKAWDNFAKIRTETLKGFLLTIARNIYIDNIRKKKKFVPLEEISGNVFNELEKNVEMNEQLNKVNKVLDNFAEIDRSAFLLRVEQEMSYEEISKILMISVTNAKVKVHRVRKSIIQRFMNEEK